MAYQAELWTHQTGLKTLLKVKISLCQEYEHFNCTKISLHDTKWLKFRNLKMFISLALRLKTSKLKLHAQLIFMKDLILLVHTMSRTNPQWWKSQKSTMMMKKEITKEYEEITLLTDMKFCPCLEMGLLEMCSDVLITKPKKNVLWKCSDVLRKTKTRLI